MSLESQVAELQQQNAALVSAVNDLVQRVSQQADTIDAQVRAAVLAVPSLERTFYVDSEQGSDANDGSESHPFKTIPYAVSHCPARGWVNIYLVGEEHEITADINISGKCVLIEPKASGVRVTLKFKAYFNSYNNLHGFTANYASGDLYLNRCNIEPDNIYQEQLHNSIHYCFLTVIGAGNGTSLYIEHSNITLGRVPLVNTHSGICDISFNRADITSDKDVIFLGSGLARLTVNHSSKNTEANWGSNANNIMISTY